LECSQSQCVEACANGETRCDGVCVDTAVTSKHCGGCGVACSADQVCNTGACGCAANAIVCANTCTDPMTDKNHCGASADCAGANTGTQCGLQQACAGGTCLSTVIYRGSL